jgi:hypothetical protein
MCLKLRLHDLYLIYLDGSLYQPDDLKDMDDEEVCCILYHCYTSCII